MAFWSLSQLGCEHQHFYSRWIVVKSLSHSHSDFKQPSSAIWWDCWPRFLDESFSIQALWECTCWCRTPKLTTLRLVSRPMTRPPICLLLSTFLHCNLISFCWCSVMNTSRRNGDGKVTTAREPESILHDGQQYVVLLSSTLVFKNMPDVSNGLECTVSNLGSLISKNDGADMYNRLDIRLVSKKRPALRILFTQSALSNWSDETVSEEITTLPDIVEEVFMCLFRETVR